MNPFLMTKERLYRVVQRAFPSYFNRWNDQRDEQGPGALVFDLGEECPLLDESPGYEFWTLAQLREYLRRCGENDEFVYKWLRSVGSGKALPVVMISAAERPADQLIFFTDVQEASEEV